ncbi:hypothetical protein P3T36_002685 [Kitasatospora sp. MAP12-15]|uniref:DUF2637 domain-containing protein n=1 Tax=unclassified Kitasatospora TaxID=2633591 RepID=UPI0024749200|nr:DUF2637 domain-containing protein [Kitasatospora sp. MAP12-44]MDH6113864.1 hypothetical protein [Kitasatospora sp. MAP12-44]
MTPLFGYVEGHIEGYVEGYAEGYAQPDDPRTAPRDRVRDGTYGPGMRYDEGLGCAVGLVYGDAPSFNPVADSAVGWEAEAAFVPHPRMPTDRAVPVMTGPPMAGSPMAGPAAPGRRRRQPARPAWPEVIGSLFGALTAVTVAAVCVLGWAFSYDPLRALAYSRVPRGLSQLWPVIVYGPWLAGCLSVLRAALHGRQPVHSWVVVVLFSGLATGLCVADVSRTLPDLVVTGLPPLTAVISLHQLVRQLTTARGMGRRPGRQAAHKSPR